MHSSHFRTSSQNTRWATKVVLELRDITGGVSFSLYKLKKACEHPLPSYKASTLNLTRDTDAIQLLLCLFSATQNSVIKYLRAIHLKYAK